MIIPGTWEPFTKKQCRICGEWKLLSEFCLSRGHYQSYCKPCDSDRAGQYRRDNLDKVRISRRLRRFGITDERFQELLQRQNGLCAICFIKLESPHIDHNHETGRIRGLLCRDCNVLIGLADDLPERLHRAALYVEWDGDPQ